MSFEIDIQTKRDLDIFATNGESKSVFDLFNFTTCKGGQDKLYKYLSNPMEDIYAINERKDVIAFFQKYLPIDMGIDKDTLSFAEYYQKHKEYSLRKPTKLWRSIDNLFLNKLKTGANYYVVEKGVKSIQIILQKIEAFCKLIESKKEYHHLNFFQRNNAKVYAILDSEELNPILNEMDLKNYEIANYNYIFRYSQYKNIQFVFELIYEYDALLSVAKAAQRYSYSPVQMVSQNETCLEVEGLFHPFVNNAVTNDVEFGLDSNLLFITGPNMGGKSTFLKALGISVYLAHVGFPVPARNFKISLLSGLCTTINIPDNIQSGHSHFYAEVLRVKQVAKQLKNNRNMMIIFDELFRGTNVKDAYDGTLAIVSAFAQIKSSFFVISTHIVEVADELRVNKNINFRYFYIQEKDGHPVYTYQLKEGISSDRLGMYIIQKECIVDMIYDILEDD